MPLDNLLFNNSFYHQYWFPARSKKKDCWLLSGYDMTLKPQKKASVPMNTIVMASTGAMMFMIVIIYPCISSLFSDAYAKCFFGFIHTYIYIYMCVCVCVCVCVFEKCFQERTPGIYYHSLWIWEK